MSRKSKLSDTQKLAIKATYDKYKLAGRSSQASMEAVAIEMGVHWQTIRTILKSKSNMPPPEDLQKVKEMHAAQIEQIVSDILTDFGSSEKHLHGITPGQVPIAVATLIDKYLKLRGEDVTKIEIVEVGEKVEKRLQELQSVKDALKRAMVVPTKATEN